MKHTHLPFSLLTSTYFLYYDLRYTGWAHPLAHPGIWTSMSRFFSLRVTEDREIRWGSISILQKMHQALRVSTQDAQRLNHNRNLLGGKCFHLTVHMAAMWKVLLTNDLLIIIPLNPGSLSLLESTLSFLYCKNFSSLKDIIYSSRTQTF